jgi:predicted  nucleic acid-binding Zn-ribbon protein
MNASLHNAHELNDALSEQCANAQGSVQKLEVTIAEQQARIQAQVHEIESLGAAYDMKAQALAELQREKVVADQIISKTHAELLDCNCEIATLKVSYFISRKECCNAELLCLTCIP